MTDTQSTQAVKSSDAYRLGIERANAPIPNSAANDHHIDIDDVVTYAPPAHLTDDYDPTYRPMALTRDGQFEVDPEAREIADYNVHAGIWKSCPECGEGIATGLRIHATCEQNLKAGVA